MSRPFFAFAWAASQRNYDPSESGPKVAEVIGGYVEKNINNPDPAQRWSNTCAVRMSYILNEAGLIIPKIPGQTVSGADKRQYFFRVRNLITFLQQRWGKPEVVVYPPRRNLQVEKASFFSRCLAGRMLRGTPPYSMAGGATISVISIRQKPLTELIEPISGACRE